MKLYYGGFGDYMEFTVAENEEKAISNIGIKINAPFLPIKVTKILEIDGFSINPVSVNGSTIEAKEVEITAEKTERHCRKCDFTCENQGELLAHYREKHPKGD